MAVPMRRIALRVGLALLILVVLGGALFAAFVHKFYPTVPASDFPPSRSVGDAQKQDLEYFRHYVGNNQAYTPEARAQVLRLLDKYEARAGQMTAAQFELAIAGMVALSDNGHSADYAGAFRRRHNKLPCLLYHFSDGYYIVRARPACQALLGARLLAIDGHAAEEIADRMYQYAAGPRNHYDQFITPFYLESPELLNAAGLAGAPDRVTLHVLMQDGATRDVPLEADPPDPKWKWWIYSDSYLTSDSTAAQPDWKAYLPAEAKVPLFISDYDNPFHLADWPGIQYVGLRSNVDEPGHPIGPFVAEVKRQIAAKNPHVVIVDLRLDQGGDFTKTAALMSHITTLSPSIRSVYVLTSAWTFSAGEISAALAKEYGGDKVTIVGQPVGDRLRLWAEGANMTLPNSRILLHFATGLHDYSKPCWGESGCFWTVYFFPMHVKSLEPDVAIPYTFADYSGLRDPVLEYVLKRARAQ